MVTKPFKLPQEKQDALNNAMRIANQLDQEIQKATECGFDCRPHAVALQQLRAQAAALIHHFGSGVDHS